MSFRKLLIRISCSKSELLIVLLLMTSGLAWAQHGKSDHNDSHPDRTDWVINAKNSLINLDITTIEKPLKVRSRMDDGLMYQRFYITKPSLIKFETGDWVYIMFHSAHDNKEIGDLSIARDQDGNFYYNQGHVCGEIGFEARTPKFCDSSLCFFTNFKEETEEIPWVKLEGNYIPDSDHSHD